MFDKVAAELNLEDKTKIDSKSKQDQGTLENYKESGKNKNSSLKYVFLLILMMIHKMFVVVETEQKPKEQAFSDKTLKQDDETGNKESVKSKNI